MNIDTKNNINSTTAEFSTAPETDTKKQTPDGQSFEDFLMLNNINLSSVDTGLLYNLISIYDMPYNYSDAVNMARNIESIKSDFCYDTMSISKADAMFFAETFDENNEIVFTPASPANFLTVMDKVQEMQEPAEVSRTLLNLIEKAYNTSKPCRLDFDNNISVILKVDREGRITANFLPSDIVAEQYLRNNIGYLKQNFDAQNIEYNEITYRNFKDNGGQQQKSKQGEENE